MKIEIEIKNCDECPFLRKERFYTSDSFEFAYDWFCTATSNEEKIEGYVEWHEEKDVKVPSWCPCKVEKL